MPIEKKRKPIALVYLLFLLCPLTTVQAFLPASDSSKTLQSALNVLDRFIGQWNLTERHFDAKGNVSATVKGSEEIGWTLDRRAIRRKYTSTSDTLRFEATGLLTWSAAEKAYVGAWFDNVSTSGPMIVRGRWDQKQNALVMQYSIPVSDGIKREFNVIERFVDESTRVATTFEITGGTVRKLTEVEYKRTVPCPAKLRVIPDLDG